MFKSLFGARTQSTLIDHAFETISGMLGHAAGMYDSALAILLDGAQGDVDFDALDDPIDDGERDVRRTVLEHLSVAPDHDLVASLVLVSIVQDAERLGDFARGLGDLAAFVDTPLEGEFADGLRAIAANVRPSFEDCRASFSDDDPDRAKALIERHVGLKTMASDYLVRLTASDLPANQVVVYTSAARFLGRVSSHLSNIASSVVQPYDRIRHGDEDA